MGSTYVIGDVHGDVFNLFSILHQINATDDDRIIFLGDIIDRTSGSLSVLETLMKMPNVHILLGNHELMMKRAIEPPKNISQLNNWLYNGGKGTFLDYLSRPKQKQCEIVDFLNTLPGELELIVNNTRFLLCHGAPRELMSRFPNQYDNPYEYGAWTRMQPEMRIPDKTVVFGHTPTAFFQRGMRIWYGPGMIGMDTGSGKGGCLAGLRLDDMTEFYSS